MKAMEKIINKQLKKSGVPPIKVMKKRLPENTDGQFSFKSWKIQINADRLQGNLNPRQFKTLSRTLYHEARHCEQWFAAARFQAGRPGASAGGISSRMKVPGKAASAAMQAPLGANKSPTAVLGEATNRSVYGDGRAYRNDVLNKPDSDPIGYEQYRGLFEEQDAFSTGDAVDC